MKHSWHHVATRDECPPGSAIERLANGRIVAIYNVDGAFHALDGICPHQGGPLGKGTLQGCIVTCPWHGWQYNVTNGRHETTPLEHPTFEVKLDGDRVLVKIPEDDETVPG